MSVYNHYGGQPVVVQGQTVTQQMPSHTYTAQTYDNVTNTLPQGTGEWTKGEKQPKRCNDVFFAILFYAHLGVMVFCAAAYAPIMFDSMYEGYANNDGDRRYLADEAGDQQAEAANDDGGDYHEANNNGDAQVDMNGLLTVLGVTGFVGLILSTLALGFMMTFSETLIKFSLIFNIITNIAMAVLFAMAGAIPLAILFLIGFAFTCYYAYIVWARIPFAAANMVTAITAVRANFGLSFFAYASLGLTFGWSIWWSIAAVSTTYVTNGCNAEGECEKQGSPLVLFLFLISYYWTVQVINNVTHVTVAGTVGTWWFAPQEANSCCSNAVRDSWTRAMTYSFGSICFGSLIVAIIQAIKEMVHQLREQDDGMLLCLAECLIGCIESLVEYFNKWAFVFVGLYGYTFMEAGKNVMTLFRSKGWTTIITDMLVDAVLTMTSVGIGVITGICGVLVAQGLGLDLGDANASIGGPFLVGFIFGFVLAGVLFSVISSAVNTVIVCYAEAPAEFQQNHPELSDRMREAWREAWPNDFRY